MRFSSEAVGFIISAAVQSDYSALISGESHKDKCLCCVGKIEWMGRIQAPHFFEVTLKSIIWMCYVSDVDSCWANRHQQNSTS